MMNALSDITILDLTRVLAGPYCTMMLADYGANVIKIEVPGKGDDTRSMGPFKNGESMYYANVNRNKKSITLNLKAEEGKKMFLEMGLPITYLAFCIDHDGPYAFPGEAFDHDYWLEAEGPRRSFSHQPNKKG